MFSKLPMFQRVGSVAYKKDLTNIIALCEWLGNPQLSFKSIHIAGTNGKGSVSHMLAAAFQIAGYKTGLYISPHYKDYRERIKLNGEYVSKRFVVEFIDKLKPLIEQINPSFFEINVAMAFEYFSQQKVDIAIIETGLGGRLDSTNIIKPVLSVITNISFDHMNMLGNTLPAIANEKAGIIKSNVPVVIGERQAEVSETFTYKATESNSQISFASDHYKVVLSGSDPYYSYFDIYKNSVRIAEKASFNLHGTFQEKNIATVLQALDVYNSVSDTDHFINLTDFLEAARQLKSLTRFMGRWQVLSEKPLIICDSGHNEAGITYVTDQIKLMKFKALHVVLGVVNDKDVDKMLSLLPKNAVYYFCKANIPRGLDSADLKEKAMRLGLKGRNFVSVKNALLSAKRAADADDLIFIGGSTFVVAEIL